MADKKTKESAAKRAGEKARAKQAEKAQKAEKASKKGKTEATEATAAAKEEAYMPAPKPKLTPEQQSALGVRREKDAERPAFRRHE